jgi:hypothetical protein
MRLPLSALLPWPSLARIALAALAAGTAAGVAALETDVPIAALSVGGAAFGVVYLAALWALGALSESERASVRALIGRVRLLGAARPERS